MTATATQTTARSLSQIAPNVTSRVKAGDLATAQNGLIAVGVLIALLGYFEVFGHHGALSYLVGYMGVLGIALCALFFTMIQHG